MRPQTVIDRQVSRQPGVSLLGVLERHGVGPFLAEGLNEPLGLAVGPWRVGPGADVLELGRCRLWQRPWRCRPIRCRSSPDDTRRHDR